MDSKLIAEQIEKARQNKEFNERLKRLHEKDKKIFDRLGA